MTDITKSFLSQAEFVSLPVNQREKLREVFNVSKSGQVKVQTTPSGEDRLVSDGTESQDLVNSINLKSVLAFLGREHKEKDVYDFGLLFQEVLRKLFPNEPVKEVVPAEAPAVKAPEPEAKPEAKGKKKKIVVTQRKKK